MSGQWKPGDVAIVRNRWGVENVAICSLAASIRGFVWKYGVSDTMDLVEDPARDARPLVVLDPEDREQVKRMFHAVLDEMERRDISIGFMRDRHVTDAAQAALCEFANPKPQEPTDPTARVTDRRENIWRLLADGDWVCTSGPDIGEYVVWSRLAAERGPLHVEVAS